MIDGEGERLFELRPDAVIETPGRHDRSRTVLGTKWKELKPNKKTLDVAQPDIYQMLAYARAYGAGRLILLYPWRKEPDKHEEPDKKGILRTWKVAEIGSETACRLDVAVVDIGSPGAVARALRTIVDDSGATS